MNDHAHESHDHHHETFLSKYVFSLDHKMIGKQFLIFGLIMFMVGGGLAMLFRWQLAWPDRPLPIIGVSKAYQEEGEVTTAADRKWEERFDDERSCEHVLSLMQEGRLEPKRLITHRFPCTDMVEAYEMAYRREKEMLGVIFQWKDV